MFATYEVCDPLTPFVECCWSWSAAAETGELEPILPDAAPEFIVHLGALPLAMNAAGRWRRQPRAFVYCAATRPLELRSEEPLRIFSIRFRPWGLARFHALPMKDCLDVAVAPHDALGPLGTELMQALLQAASDAERKQRADELLLRALERHHSHADHLRLLAEAVDGGRASASEIASRLGMSNRSFHRLWHDVVGMEPRKFVTLMRFHRALAMIDTGAALASVAADCGYADQAHLARQIKAIAGLPATALRRRLGTEAYRNLYGERPTAPWRA